MERQESTQLDDLDLQIVRLLQNEGRLSVPEIARRVNTSRPTAYARFKRLVEDGTITGFQAQIDHRRLGLPVAALLLIETHQSQWRTVADELLDDPSVVWLGLITGPADLAVLVRAESLGHLRDVILNDVTQATGVKSIETNILLEELGRP